MGVNSTTEFDTFEKQVLELIGEFQTLASNEGRLREALRAETTRAESAEAARDAICRAAAEARSSAAAAGAGAAQAYATLAKVQDELAATKMQFELAECHRIMLEEKSSEMSNQLEEMSKELEKLRPLENTLSNQRRMYLELQENVENATLNARRESSHLENELRRIEKSASGGAEIRERARLAAAAHVRERKLAAAELQHTSQELSNAKAEVTRLGALVAELQYRISGQSNQASKLEHLEDDTAEALVELRKALEAERAGTAKLEATLMAALADNATLAAALHSKDNVQEPDPQSQEKNSESTTIGPIDSFLAD